ncbi:MAG: putative DNA-binding domain-containing protein [Bryobacteraceae bacterium]
MTNLEVLQRWFLAAILPGGGRGSSLARRHIREDGLSAARRLRIYQRDCRARMLQSLEEDFPSVRRFVGSGRFRSLCLEYLRGHPSRSFTLGDLGRAFPEWCARAERLEERERRAAAALARLEWAAIEVADAADSEPLKLDTAARLTGESRLRLAPSVRVLTVPAGATDYLLENSRRHRWPQGREYVAVFRGGSVVYFHRLTAGEWRVLRALAGGAPLAEAVVLGGREFDAEASFREWTGLGWFGEPVHDLNAENSR